MSDLKEATPGFLEIAKAVSRDASLVIRPCKRWRRQLELEIRGDTITIRMMAPQTKKTKSWHALAFNILNASNCAIVFSKDPAHDMATLCVGQYDSMHLSMSRQDGLRVLETLRLKTWTWED